MNNKRPILLVEDDSIDAMTVKRAVKELKITNPLVVCENGQDALNYLQNKNNELPVFILLDLNMPKMNGIEFLSVIKAHELLKMLPVIVLTTSKDDQDKIDTFKFSVAGYMVKPVSYQIFVDAMKAIEMYWTLSELPGDIIFSKDRMNKNK